MKFLSTVLALMAACVFEARAASVDIETCADWEAAVEANLEEDTTATIITSAAFFGDDCGDGSFKTLEVKNNHLTVVAPTLSAVDGPQFFSIRFTVTDGGELTVTPNVEFNASSDEDLEVNGGFLHVGEGSKARFLGDLDVNSFAVRSVPVDGDFSDDIWEGGCVYNAGYFRVDGYASFSRCDNIGGGESSPGDGGAIFNTETGSILFQGGLLIEETYVTDDEGSSGAGIYNQGKVNIKGDALFQRLGADTDSQSGGAIFNAEGAKFTFRNKASATFIDTSAARGGGVYNAGEFSFSGPALFTLCEGSAIHNASPGVMKISKESVFWRNSAGSTIVTGAAITNLVGATLDIPDEVQFEGNVRGGDSEDTCDDVYLQEAAGSWRTDMEAEEFTCYP